MKRKRTAWRRPAGLYFQVCTFANTETNYTANGPCLRENRKRLGLRLRRRIGAAGGVHHLAGVGGVRGGGLVEN